MRNFYQIKTISIGLCVLGFSELEFTIKFLIIAFNILHRKILGLMLEKLSGTSFVRKAGQGQAGLIGLGPCRGLTECHPMSNP